MGYEVSAETVAGIGGLGNKRSGIPRPTCRNFSNDTERCLIIKLQTYTEPPIAHSHC
jgi:hypothetical protein